MNTYKVMAYRHGQESHKSRIFILEAVDEEDLIMRFRFKYPQCSIVSFSLYKQVKIKPKGLSPIKQRSHFKARLCQIRNNLQSMTDSESPYLTHEEIIQLQRISCKVDNIISKFGMRTMDLKKEGIL